MTDVHHRSATELVALLAAGEVSSVELLDHFLARIERDGPAINAVVALDVERARARAAEADAARARGESWGPLHGLPMTVKDAFETEGLVTTSGAPELRDHVPDAGRRRRRPAAGGRGGRSSARPTCRSTPRDLQTYNEVYGRTNNPWDARPGGRRVVGRRRGGAGRRADRARARQRHRRLDPQPGALLRRVRAQADVGDRARSAATSPGPPGRSSVADVGVAGPDGPQRRRPGPRARRAGRAGRRRRRRLAPRAAARRATAARVEGLRVATWFDAPAAADRRATCGPPLDRAASALSDAGAAVTAVARAGAARRAAGVVGAPGAAGRRPPASPTTCSPGSPRRPTPPSPTTSRRPCGPCGPSPSATATGCGPTSGASTTAGGSPSCSSATTCCWRR